MFAILHAAAPALREHAKARSKALEAAASRTLYLDLGRLCELQNQRGTPFTPAVHAYYALVEALKEYADEGGRRARYSRYFALAEQVHAGLAGHGIEPLLPPAESSVALRAYHLPQGIDYPTLHDALKARGFVIYAGQGDLSKTLFRISTMGTWVPRTYKGWWTPSAICEHCQCDARSFHAPEFATFRTPRRPECHLERLGCRRRSHRARLHRSGTLAVPE